MEDKRIVKRVYEAREIWKWTTKENMERKGYKR
jgi:hypothetical protein